jgi:hypothetical protein
VSYLHPAYNRLLPPTARPQLIAYLQLVERNCYASKDGWADVRQAVIGHELGRSVWAVRRYERVCLAAGIIEVEHHRRGNRRRLRLRTAKQALAINPKPRQSPIREWGHACPHSGSTRALTVSQSHLYPRARVLLEETSSDSQTLKPASPADRAAPSRRETPTRTPIPTRPKVPEAVIKRVTALVTPMGGRWAPKVSELVFELLRAQGERQTLGYLDIVQERVDGQVSPYARAKAALALLNARLRKLSEGRGPRSGRNPFSARFGA